MFKSDDIILTTIEDKKRILLNQNNLINIKIYTLNEFNKLFYFNYDLKTIKYVMDKYNVIYEIAKIYLDNLYYLEEKDYKNSKLIFLSDLKKDLYNKKLIKTNKLFLNSLKNRRVVIYNLSTTKELIFTEEKLREISQVEVINDENTCFPNHTIYELKNIEDEVVFVANYICDLLSQGININNIYITNLNDEYRKLIKRIFPMFNIPITLQDNQSIYGTFLVSKFIELYQENIEETLNELKTYVNTKESEKIYNKIVEVVNKYVIFDDYLEVLPMIKSDLKNTNIFIEDNEFSVHEQSLKDFSFNNKDYVFTMSFNQGIIPIIHKDELYLTDIDKEELSISYTIDKNIAERNEIIKCLNSIENLIITYKLKANGEDFYISNINEELKYNVIKNNSLKNNYSNLYNKIKLISLKDEFYKYGTKNKDLYILNNHYNDLLYNSYQHKFTGINCQDLHTFLNNKITLSYTSIDKYYRCPFSFYLNYILKLNIYEETFFQIIGTLFHRILEKYSKTTLNYNELWDQEIKKFDHPFTNKEIFFLKRLKEELLFIIETIDNQNNFTDLKEELHEEKIYTSISGDIKITFTGIIDKIKYKKEEGQTIIAIIDYKTGNPNLDLTTIPYGIEIQLPIYLYLAKNSSKLTNIKVAGFYLQKILNNEVTVDKSLSYEQAKKKNLLLQGYSNSNIEILSTFDKSYIDSNIIKSMKVKNDNSFYSYSKVLSDKQMDYIANIAEEKIKECSRNITKADFSISPKKIGKENKGCNLCKFKDICFHTADDIVELKELSKEEVLEGDLIGMD